MNARMLSLAVALLGMSLSATGGVVLRQVQVTESSDEEASGRQVSQVWIEGDRMKTVFEESANPMLPAGSYLLVPGGDLMYLVNPAQKTIARMDMAEMEAMGEKGQEMAEKQAEASGHKTEVADVTIEQTLDEAGPEMLGFPTRHYRYELSYTEKQHMRGMPGSLNTVVREQHEFWATEALQDEPAIRDLRAADLAGAADDDVRKEVEETQARMHAHGLFLKHVLERNTTTSMGGGTGLMRMMPGMNDSSRERISMEVTELKRATLSAADFELPKGFAETEFFAPGASGMPDLNALPGQNGQGMPDLDSMPGAGEDGSGAGMPDLDKMPR